MGLLIILYLIWLKVSCYFYIYLKTLSLFINFIRGIVNRLNLLTKHRQKLMNLRNPRISLIFIDYNQNLTISIFLLFISMIFSRILNLKQLISWLQKVFLYTLIYRLVCFNVFKIKCIYFLYSSIVLMKMKILFKQITIILSIKSFKIWLIIAWNIVSILINPNSKIKYLKYPNLVLNAVFYLYSFLIWIRLYTPGKSKVINY